jgi:hypothetical protein
MEPTVLDPDDRTLLLDALRPPAGYVFDRAVATSYTLDVHALLTAPLALAAFDHEATDGSIPTDPVALVEALRRCAERIDVFCQAGAIGVPPKYHRLYAWVEHCVHECTPPTAWASFHPKLWVLRFAAADADDDVPLRYRLLCSSRNLTFDRNWDVLVALDGESDEDAANGAPLADLVRRLPGLATQRLESGRQSGLRAIADELRRVRFAPPPGFDDATVHVLGMGADSPLPSEADKLLVVSPFVTAGALDRLRTIAPDMDVIARAEELDRMPEATLDSIRACYVLAPAAVPTIDDDGSTRPLVGLHAKLFIAERGRFVDWFVGSANATDAGLGANVEVLVQLTGSRARVGIDTVYDGAEGHGLRRLLQEYRRIDEPKQDSDDELLQRLVDRLARRLAAAHVHVQVAARDDEHFDLHLTGDVVPAIEEGSASVIVRPLTLSTGERVSIGAPLDVRFPGVAFETISAFVVIEIVARLRSSVLSMSLLVRGDLDGAPHDRIDRLLSSLLATRADVLRYLMFLLADAEGALLGIEESNGASSGVQSARIVEIPLLELIVRRASRDPARLRAVDRLARSLLRTEDGRALLPDGFDGVWSAIAPLLRTGVGR